MNTEQTTARLYERKWALESERSIIQAYGDPAGVVPTTNRAIAEVELAIQVVKEDSSRAHERLDDRLMRLHSQKKIAAQFANDAAVPGLARAISEIEQAIEIIKQEAK